MHGTFAKKHIMDHINSWNGYTSMDEQAENTNEKPHGRA